MLKQSYSEHSAKLGAAKIVKICLGLVSKQQLLVVCDETTIEVAKILADAAMDADVEPSIFFVPKRQQQLVTLHGKLWSTLENAVLPTKALVTALCNDQETMGFRKALIRHAKAPHRVIGHMPGASVSILAAADVDYDDIEQRCNALARALALGNVAKVETVDCQGRRYTLEIDLGGWERMPVKSNGIIQLGTWGNLPAGETYIAPVSGNGQIVINGTLDNLILADKEIILTFEAGRLVGLQPDNGAAGRRVAELKAFCEQRSDKNWNYLAELGIGVNRQLVEFTGVALVDEKVYGTCHVAIGHNEDFGGKINSNIHVDIVTRNPSIIIDGVAWLKRGHHCYENKDLQEDHNDMMLDVNSECWQVKRTGQPALTERRRLYRRWYNGRGDEELFMVGDNETAKLAARFYRCIPSDDSLIAVKDLRKKLDQISNEMARVLRIMEKYQLIEIIH